SRLGADSHWCRLTASRMWCVRNEPLTVSPTRLTSPSRPVARKCRRLTPTGHRKSARPHRKERRRRLFGGIASSANSDGLQRVPVRMPELVVRIHFPPPGRHERSATTAKEGEAQ